MATTVQMEEVNVNSSIYQETTSKINDDAFLASDTSFLFHNYTEVGIQSNDALASK